MAMSDPRLKALEHRVAELLDENLRLDAENVVLKDEVAKLRVALEMAARLTDKDVEWDKDVAWPPSP